MWILSLVETFFDVSDNDKQQARDTTTITTHSIASQYLTLSECSQVDGSDKSLEHYHKLCRELEFQAPCATVIN